MKQDPQGFLSYLIEHPLVGGWLKMFWQRIYKQSSPARYIIRKAVAPEKKNAGIIIFSSLLIVFVLIGLMVAAVVFEVSDPLDLKIVVVDIPPGTGAFSISALLVENKVLKSAYGFNLIVSRLGLTSRLKAGRYEFSPSMSLFVILKKLLTGQAEKGDKITFPEGTSIYKMARILEKNNIKFYPEFEMLVQVETMEAFSEKHSFLKEIKKSLEGYLFPDTYFIAPDFTQNDLANMMLFRFDKLVMPFWITAEVDTELSLHEIVTLASIIEKEASDPDERDIISSVYHNRLKLGMKLDADPTIKYMLERPGKKVLYADLKVKSPYNTYRNPGLPPGPISNPGFESIVAAVYPASTRYLYFVARPNGKHIFSTNFQEHKNAKQKARIEQQ